MAIVLWYNIGMDTSMRNEMIYLDNSAYLGHYSLERKDE